MNCSTCTHLDRRFHGLTGAILYRCALIPETYQYVGLQYPCHFEPSKWEAKEER